MFLVAVQLWTGGIERFWTLLNVSLDIGKTQDLSASFVRRPLLPWRRLKKKKS